MFSANPFFCLSLQNIPIDLQSLKLIDVHLFLRSAQQHLFTALGALASMFKTSAQLRLENLVWPENSIKPNFMVNQGSWQHSKLWHPSRRATANNEVHERAGKSMDITYTSASPSRLRLTP